MGTEKGSEYYDDFFNNSENFHCHYKDSFYYVHWTQVIRCLRKIQNPEILEIGTGTGQLAEYIRDEGFESYSGFDFSNVAIETAKSRNSQWHFWVGDARDGTNYQHQSFNTVICLEVLEHIKEDLQILQNLPENINVIFSVPNFDAPSHVRWFTSERQVKKRYYRYIQIQEIVTIGNIYIVRGLRSNFDPTFLQAFFASREDVKLSSFLIRIKHRLKNLFKLKSI